VDCTLAVSPACRRPWSRVSGAASAASSIAGRYAPTSLRSRPSRESLMVQSFTCARSVPMLFALNLSEIPFKDP
jgi:hypothetical protein